MLSSLLLIVSYQNIVLQDNMVNINYLIEPGNKAKITKISFIGSKIYKDKKLRNVILSEESKFWKFISDKKFLNEEIIELDKRLLKNYYKNKGYYEVDIKSTNVEYAEGDGFVGFIHQVVIDNYLNHHEAPEDIELYFCGPPLMNQAVQKMGEDFGIPDENIRFDDFGG